MCRGICMTMCVNMRVCARECARARQCVCVHACVRGVTVHSCIMYTEVRFWVNVCMCFLVCVSLLGMH